MVAGFVVSACWEQQYFVVDIGEFEFDSFVAGSGPVVFEYWA